MKKFDLAFSMGFSCGGTMALRKAGLQFVSYPLDWIGSPGIVQSARMIESEFSGWFEKSDLQLVAVRGGSFNNNVYQNRVTRFGYPHDFTRMRKFDEIYPAVAAKYERRVARFLTDVSEASDVLVVYIERPINARAADDDLRAAKQILECKFPKSRFELVYFFLDEGRAGYAETVVDDGITAVACDYVQYDYGEVSHAIRSDVQYRYLVDRYHIDDKRTQNDKDRYESERRASKKRKVSVAGNVFQRKVSEWQYRLYRKLEKILQDKDLVARDYPLWFD